MRKATQCNKIENPKIDLNIYGNLIRDTDGALIEGKDRFWHN